MKRFAIMAALLASTATAQDADGCFKRQEVVDAFKNQTEQVPRMRALSSAGTVYEVLANQAGDWLLIIVLPDGRACPRAMGDVVVWIAPGVPG